MSISNADDQPPPSWRRLHEAAYLVPRAIYGFGHLGPRGPVDGPPALVIPGFIANDRTTMELRRALAAVVDSPLGELSGAVQWLTPARVRVDASEGALRVSTVVPWPALSALADAMRGDVGQDRVR